MAQHTPFTRSLHLFAGIALLAGIGLTALHAPLFASLSSAGTVPVAEEVSGALLQQTPVAAANPLAQAQAAAQLSLGLLLIVLGFFLHGLARTREERPVHITVVPGKKQRSRWFWMEMRV